MPMFKISAVFEYAGVVDGDSEEDAMQNFWDNLNDYYTMTQDSKIELVPICSECELSPEDCECSECDCER